MNKVLVILALFYGLTAKGQVNLVVNKNGFHINDVALPKSLNMKKMKGILGSPERTFQGINYVHTFDEFGIRCYQPRGSSQINSIVLDFTPGTFEFSPKSLFKGEVMINGVKLHDKFTKDSLEIIPNLYFDEKRPIEHGYLAVTHNDVQIRFEFNEKGLIGEVGISFSNEKGIYKENVKKYNSNFSLESLLFVYEKGEKINDKKIGVWEYYDEPNELALKFDHDKNELIFQNKCEEEFVVKNDFIWEPIELSIYPRNIGTEKEFYSDLSQLINYPIQARKTNISGDVYVSFEIDVDGRLKNSKILKDPGGGCGQEVLNALNNMKEPWIVAMNKNNVKFKSRFIMRINFQLIHAGKAKKSKLPSIDKVMLPMATRLKDVNITAIGSPQPIAE